MSRILTIAFLGLFLGVILIGGNFLIGVTSTTEQGVIEITAPSGTVSNADQVDGGPLYSIVSVRSTFAIDKLASVLINGQLIVDGCRLKANTMSNCDVAFPNPGKYSIVVETSRRVGKENQVETVSASTDFEWKPYTGIDKIALAAAQATGSNDPTHGYLLFGILVFAVATYAGVRLGNGNPAGMAVGGLAMVVVSLIGLATMLSFSSAETGYKMGLAVAGLLSALISGVVVLAIAWIGFSFKVATPMGGLALGTNRAANAALAAPVQTQLPAGSWHQPPQYYLPEPAAVEGHFRED